MKAFKTPQEAVRHAIKTAAPIIRKHRDEAEACLQSLAKIAPKSIVKASKQ